MWPEPPLKGPQDDRLPAWRAPGPFGFWSFRSGFPPVLVRTGRRTFGLWRIRFPPEKSRNDAARPPAGRGLRRSGAWGAGAEGAGAACGARGRAGLAAAGAAAVLAARVSGARAEARDRARACRMRRAPRACACVARVHACARALALVCVSSRVCYTCRNCDLGVGCARRPWRRCDRR